MHAHVQCESGRKRTHLKYNSLTCVYTFCVNDVDDVDERGVGSSFFMHETHLI